MPILYCRTPVSHSSDRITLVEPAHYAIRASASRHIVWASIVMNLPRIEMPKDSNQFLVQRESTYYLLHSPRPVLACT
eukprot:scaffold6422_cov69-Cyclotella_meneghiniana.AAC.2